MQLSRSILGVLSGRCSGGVRCGALVFGASDPLAQTLHGERLGLRRGSAAALPLPTFLRTHLATDAWAARELVAGSCQPVTAREEIRMRKTILEAQVF